MNTHLQHIFFVLNIIVTCTTLSIKAAAGTTDAGTSSLSACIASRVASNELKVGIYLAERCYDTESGDYRQFVSDFLGGLSNPTTVTGNLEMFLQDLGFIQKGLDVYEQQRNRLDYMHYIINLFPAKTPIRSIMYAYNHLYASRQINEAGRLVGPYFLHLGLIAEEVVTIPMSHAAVCVSRQLIPTKETALGTLASTKNMLETLLKKHEPASKENIPDC